MTRPVLTMPRRAFLSGAAGGALLAAAPARAQDTQAAGSDGTFAYEVTRSPDEWRAALTDEQFRVLREGATERPNISPYASRNDPGTYRCIGCDLPLFRSDHWTELPMGFVFFTQAIPNAVLLGIETTDYNGLMPEPIELTEVHCRRCGGHLGHIIAPDADPLHCINGTALRLDPAEA
ncbi:hypothetical protein OCGS_0265 [Oceaniovalibus guishaninsula JLT2003]|uniref:peptide-methionine (R)-S-oxide reductase n=1 Tax=Oceaniovalibus guishaninsula JLT2003 TaxID=1231392 RepID=K2HDW4_9RHOB|nr:peptide-methionine (R)-S-oxide reductase [Oceaniovalibus guishaninsula]EKE45648.1 hypothetical protein OCGS_0265 [Oceaniovalibus guishaninsula JLT2003]